MKEHIEELFKFGRELTGPGFNDALDYLAKELPLTIHEWKPRQSIWTWMTPETGLRLGEYTLKGESDETIIVPIHLDHPKMANDNLSGVAVILRLIRILPPQKYGYTFLFLPETIGTIAWLSRFGTDYKYGIVIDSVGTDGDLVTTLTKTPSLLNFYTEGKTNDFFSDAHLMTGNDERVLESVGIPSIQISRTPFKEYHTILDVPDIISEDRLEEALDCVYNLLRRINTDFIPKPRYKGVPCLSTHGLWKEEYDIPENFIKVERVWQLIDGIKTVAQIAKLSNLPYEYVYEFIRGLAEKNLIWNGRI